MYTVILLAAIGVVAGFCIAGKGTAKLAGIGFGAAVGAFIGLFVGLGVTSFTPKIDVVYGPATMVSMRTTDGVAGTFVWGTGGIHGESSYNFMIKQADNSITPRSVTADALVAIIEDESLKGIGYWSTTYREPDPSSALYNWGTGHRKAKELVRQEFKVPVGTVVQTFKVQ